MDLSPHFTPFQFLFCKAVPALALALSLTPAKGAVTTLWSYELKFDTAHGFDSIPAPRELEGRAGTANPAGGTWTGESTRTYDVMKPDAVAGYVSGSDGVNDLTITTRVLGNSADSWSRLNATIDSNNGLGANAVMQSGKSHPGDWGVVAYTVSFSSSLNLTANDIAVRLSNVNGDGEVYEWAMVTLGKAEEAPFASLDGSGKLTTTIGSYGPTDYSNFGASTYYNADGSVKVGGTASNAKLPWNKTMTQVLAGQPAGSGDYLNADGSLNNRASHVVQGGWVALDNFMNNVFDAPPSDSNTAPPINPRNVASNYDDEVDVTGALLGVNPLSSMNSFTIWLGYTDIATAQANGTTKTNADMLGYVSSIRIGSSIETIPEPGIMVTTVLAGMGLLLRRKR